MRHVAAVMGAAGAFLVPVAGAGAAVAHPDDRALHGRELVTPTAAIVAHSDDRPRHGWEPVGPLATITPRAEAGGFDWLDAGVGAAGVVGLGLLTAGSYVLVVRRRRTAFS